MLPRDNGAAVSSFHLRVPGDGFGPTGHRQPGETEGRFPRQSLWRRPLRRRLAKQTGTGSGTPTSRPNSIGPITPIRTRSMPIFLRKSWLATGAWSGITKSSPMRSRLSSQSGSHRAEPVHSLRLQYWANRTASGSRGWAIVGAGACRSAKKSPTGLKLPLSQAPGSAAAIVSPRLKGKDNTIACTQTWSSWEHVFEARMRARMALSAGMKPNTYEMHSRLGAGGTQD